MSNAPCKHPSFLSRNRFFNFLSLAFALAWLTGCNIPISRDTHFYTYEGRRTLVGDVQYEMPSVRLTGAYSKDLPGYEKYGANIQPSGDATPFDTTTDLKGQYLYSNQRMPATWSYTAYPTKTCLSHDSPYSQLPYPATFTQDMQPGVGYTDFSFYNSDPGHGFFDLYTYAPVPVVAYACFTNTPNNPDPEDRAYPAFVLDSALPLSVNVAALDAISTPPSTTHLKVIGAHLNSIADVTASGVASNGMSAQFPFPTLSSGLYLSVIQSEPTSGAAVTHGATPIIVAHDDQTFTGAFGVAVAIGPQFTDIESGASDAYGDGTCAGPGYSNSSTTGVGGSVPVVSLITQNSIAVGVSSKTYPTGTSPTVVIPFHGQPQDFYSYGTCSQSEQHYTGNQSVFVVNTGSNSVQVVQIGDYSYPSGTVSVGQKPVAAVVDANEAYAYVANYADGTISQIDLNALSQTRVLTVFSHPTTLSFDSTGALWVAGQGKLAKVNIANWQVSSITSVDGTINSFAYDAQHAKFVTTMTQNGTGTSRSNYTTNAALVSYGNLSQPSYSTTASFDPSTNTTVVSNTLAGDTSAYATSTVVNYLAHPAQTANVAPLVAANGDQVTATASGTTFTLYFAGSGIQLLSGTTPYPVRSLAVTGDKIYFTMPDSNSLVTVPMLAFHQ